MASIELYGPKYSTFTRSISIALKEKGIDYTLHEVDLLKGEHLSEAHMARHPFGKVPALADGDFMLYETAAALDYVEGTSATKPLVPSDNRERARMRQIQCVVDTYTYGPAIGGVFWQRAIEPMTGGQTDESIIAETLPQANKAFRALDDLASGGGFLVGDSMTLADAMLVPVYDYIQQIPDGAATLEGCDKLKTWWSTIQSRDSVTSTTPAS